MISANRSTVCARAVAAALICVSGQATVAPFIPPCRSIAVSASRKPRNFEKALTELEALVERLEHGDLSLEESLKAFEAGVRLTQECQQALTQARQRVQLLTAQDGAMHAEAFGDDMGEDQDAEQDDADADDDA